MRVPPDPLQLAHPTDLTPPVAASAFSGLRAGDSMASEAKRQYGPKDLDEAYNAKGCGIRSEQMCFVG